MDMAVKPPLRRNGAGGLMLEHLRQWFLKQGIGRIESGWPPNTMGRSFWEKHGFRDYMLILYLDL